MLTLAHTLLINAAIKELSLLLPEEKKKKEEVQRQGVNFAPLKICIHELFGGVIFFKVMDGYNTFILFIHFMGIEPSALHVRGKGSLPLSHNPSPTYLFFNEKKIGTHSVE